MGDFRVALRETQITLYSRLHRLVFAVGRIDPQRIAPAGTPNEDLTGELSTLFLTRGSLVKVNAKSCALPTVARPVSDRGQSGSQDRGAIARY